MTLSEFKAWFEGFTESMEGAPSEKQFKRIKAKVAEITGTPISYPVFINRYPDYQRYWGNPTWSGVNTAYSAGSVGQGVGNAVLVNQIQTRHYNDQLTQPFDSISAMHAVGQADAMN